MLKLGVVTRAGLRRPRTLLGRPRHVSLLVLQQLIRERHVTADEYDAVAWYSPMPNGVWKLTSHGRLRAVDLALSEVLQDAFPVGCRLTVCDLAASTGATSLELYRMLRETFDVNFIATDLYRDVVAVRSRRWPAAVVFDTRGHAIQYVIGPFVLPGGTVESALYPVNRALHRVARRWLLPEAEKALSRIDLAQLLPFETLVAEDRAFVRLPVLTGEVLDTLCSRDDFQFEVWDILDPIPVRAHVVRAMNILGDEHLGEDARRRALRNCVAALHPGGLLVVGSSLGPQSVKVSASIYKVRDDGLTRVRTVHGGSGIDGLVASMFVVRDPQGEGCAA